METGQTNWLTELTGVFSLLTKTGFCCQEMAHWKVLGLYSDESVL